MVHHPVDQVFASQLGAALEAMIDPPPEYPTLTMKKTL